MSIRKNLENYKHQFSKLIGKILVLKGTINNSRAFLSLAFLYRGFLDYKWISRIATFRTKKIASSKNIRSVKTDRKILVLKGTINNGRVFPSLAFLYRGLWDCKWISNRGSKDCKWISRIVNFRTKKNTASSKNIRSVKTDRRILVLKGTINNGRVFPDLAFSTALNLN